ncbi:hypothetical protein BDR26DRAFT_851627 [Obelidium mucronatum]|nr:hypothetical protein BDR26DRAFT_851627 [Obelidium mucronatum]
MTDSRNICILLSLASPSLAGVYWALDNVCTKGDKVTILCVVDKESEREQVNLFWNIACKNQTGLTTLDELPRV